MRPVPMEHRDAVTKFCPYAHPTESSYTQPSCLGKNCMAWLVIEKEHEREDHSGARDYLGTIMCDEGRRWVSIQERKDGCTDKVYLPERGICNYFQRF